MGEALIDDGLERGAFRAVCTDQHSAPVERAHRSSPGAAAVRLIRLRAASLHGEREKRSELFGGETGDAKGHDESPSPRRMLRERSPRVPVLALELRIHEPALPATTAITARRRRRRATPRSSASSHVRGTAEVEVRRLARILRAAAESDSRFLAGRRGAGQLARLGRPLAVGVGQGVGGLRATGDLRLLRSAHGRGTAHVAVSGLLQDAAGGDGRCRLALERAIELAWRASLSSAVIAGIGVVLLSARDGAGRRRSARVQPARGRARRRARRARRGDQESNQGRERASRQGLHLAILPGASAPIHGHLFRPVRSDVRDGGRSDLRR